MKTKYALGLLAAIFVISGMVLAQETAPPADMPEVSDNVFSLLVNGSGFLGVHAEDINKENMGRYGLNQVRGVGVTQVVKDSPAEKAGIRKDDVILRLDGDRITSVRKLNRLVSEIAPDQSVRIAISRSGAEQELTATIGKRQNTFSSFDEFGSTDPKVWRWEGQLHDQAGDLVFALGNRRRIGVTTTELTKQLAEYFGIADGRGVLVSSVTEDGPSASAGLKAGDVITAVDGEKVDSTGDISRIVNRKKEGDVTLTVVRNKSQQTIRVTPKDAKASFGTLRTRPTIGRQIVIPRISFPTIPEMNISIPRIEIPSVPPVNIRLPRVTPRVRVIRSTSGPI
ncbi:MAG TPA: PDZ domain-containing protein [Pyrinomonadaceae bacterium]